VGDVGDDCLTDYLERARSILEDLDPATGPIQEPLQATASFEELRWFLLPDEVAADD